MTTNTYTGTLKDGLIAIGGETTGWLLMNCPEIEGGSIEVVIDAVRVDAERLKGTTVVITGEVFEKRLVERGVVKRLRAESIRESR